MLARRPILLVLPILAAGLVYTLLPKGAFGSHDVIFRALVTGLAATLVAIAVFGKRPQIN